MEAVILVLKSYLFCKLFRLGLTQVPEPKPKIVFMAGMKVITTVIGLTIQ